MDQGAVLAFQERLKDILDCTQPLIAGTEVSPAFRLAFFHENISRSRQNIDGPGRLEQFRRRWGGPNRPAIPLHHGLDITIRSHDRPASLLPDLKWLVTTFSPQRLRLDLKGSSDLLSLFVDPAVNIGRLERLSFNLFPNEIVAALPFLCRAALGLSYLTLDVCRGASPLPSYATHWEYLQKTPLRFDRLVNLTILEIPSAAYRHLSSTLLGYLCSTMTCLRQLNICDGATILLRGSWPATQLFIRSMDDRFVNRLQRYWRKGDGFVQNLEERMPRLTKLETSQMTAEAVAFLPRNLTQLKCGHMDADALQALFNWLDNLAHVSLTRIDFVATLNGDWQQEWAYRDPQERNRWDAAFRSLKDVCKRKNVHLEPDYYTAFRPSNFNANIWLR